MRLRARSVLAILSLATATLASACGDANNDAEDDDVGVGEDKIAAETRGFVAPNDVSYLFPYLPGSREDLDLLISADERAGDAAAIWPDELWDPGREGSVMWAAQHLDRMRGDSDLRATGSVITLHSFINFGDGALDRHNWKITSFRFDPCAAPPTGSVDPCATELRLVLQPVANDGDAAAHFIYRFAQHDGRLDLQARDAVIDDLVRLGKEARRIAPSSASAAFGVHPALVSAERRSFVQHVRSFLLTHLRRDRLAEIAFFGEIWRDQFRRSGGGSDIWEFYKGSVVDGGQRFELEPIPSIAAAASLGLQRSQMVNVRLGFISPVAARPADRTRIDNAEIGTARDTDCASCHEVGTGPGRMTTNLRMLGPFKGAMTIKPRIIAETDKVVREVNHILASP